jgi:hypothetical protein
MAVARRPGSTGFLRATAFHESGWRFDSPSDVRQGFRRLGWRTDKTDLALTMSYAYNTLIGNGLQDYRLLATELFQRLYHPGQHRQPLSRFQFHRPAHLQRAS